MLKAHNSLHNDPHLITPDISSPYLSTYHTTHHLSLPSLPSPPALPRLRQKTLGEQAQLTGDVAGLVPLRFRRRGESLEVRELAVEFGGFGLEFPHGFVHEVAQTRECARQLSKGESELVRFLCNAEVCQNSCAMYHIC